MCGRQFFNKSTKVEWKIMDVYAPGKNHDDPLVIIEEETVAEVTGGGRI